MSLEIYPKNISADSDFPLFFIEFHSWDDGTPTRWKIYQRSFIFPLEEHKKLVEKEVEKTVCENKEDYKKFLTSMREGHAFWLIDGELLPDGCIPDKKWLLWMVDALNEKAKRQNDDGRKV